MIYVPYYSKEEKMSYESTGVVVVVSLGINIMTITLMMNTDIVFRNLTIFIESTIPKQVIRLYIVIYSLLDDYILHYLIVYKA